MLFEIEAFTSDLIAGLRRGPFRLHGAAFDIRTTCFLPLRPETWRRMRALAPAIGHMASISDYWRRRAGHFIYLYSRSQSVLCAGGYFDQPYLGRFVDAARQDYAKPIENPVQQRVYDAFQETDGPEIRAWYPLLPSLIEHYDLAKNLSVARDIARHIRSTDEAGVPLRVLEIGAGGCLLPLLLRRLLPIERYEIVDLPFVMPLGATMLDCFAPELTLALPEEGETGAPVDVRFQLADSHHLDDRSVDVAVNVTSFGEMSAEQVDSYFDTIARVLRPGGLFLCLNREDKVTRFADYPWDRLGGDVLLDEPDAFSFYHSPGQSLRRRIVRVA